MSDTVVTTMPAKNFQFWHVLAGILMIGLGLYIWFNPVESLLALALYLGIVFIVVGGGYFVISFMYRSGWYMFLGLLDIFVGVIFVMNLNLTAVSLPWIFALWCLVVGCVQVVNAFQNRSAGWSWSWLISGILGIIFGFLILSYPALGAVTITALMGAYVILYGILEVAGFRYLRETV